MSVTTINEISEDILLEIFRWLDGKTLKDAALACK